MNINGKPIKCIAFDLDHTVINSDGSMSDVTKATLKQAIADGIVVLPVSGRAFATFPEAICEMEGIDYVVTSNGAAVSYRLEISHKNSGKSIGLRYVLDKLGITPEETIAFGDGDNDAEMLAMAGIGVAMENATENCKAAADIICGCCENDGVARFLYGF